MKYELRSEHQHNFPEDLPETKVRATGQHILVLVEPLPVKSKLIEVVTVNDFDENNSLGVGWVLSAADHYYHVPPHKMDTSKIPDAKDMTHKYQMPVKRGDRIGFRRFLRSQSLMQGDAFKRGDLDHFPGYEVVFLNVRDLIGLIHDDDAAE